MVVVRLAQRAAPTRSPRCWPRRGSPPAQGTVALNVWLRLLGARIGRGVWCDTYWLPETDLVNLDDGATVNRGCVVQTHLFHDRVLSMDTVDLQGGCDPGAQQRYPAGRDDRAARHRRPGVAGDARGGGPFAHPLDRQPDRPVGGPVSAIRASDPTSPPRRRVVRRRALRPRLGYQLIGNRLDGDATLSVRRARRHRPRHPRPRRTPRRQGAASTASPSRYTPPRRAARGSPAPLAAGQEFELRVKYAGTPAPLKRAPPRRRRLGGADRRRHRRRPAARRAVLVPVQRPPRRQGDLRASRWPRRATTTSP